MLHDIFPKIYDVQYKNRAPQPCDTVFLFDDDKICCSPGDGEASFPSVSDFPGISLSGYRYLFSIDSECFFMPDVCVSGRVEPPQGYEYREHTLFRIRGPRYLAFAAITAQALYQWYASSRFCGKCGAETKHADNERASVCVECGLVAYPKISPVVIVAVRNGEKLLVTRYKDRPYRRYALVAGFSESGESLEDTVRREVLEETGVRVKNITYYKSQPWGLTSTLLSGFFCDLDGDPAIHIDENELSEAVWLTRRDIPPPDVDIALTAEMMEVFRLGRDR